MLKLEEKIRNKSAKIGIVGLGYVGLPLAVALSNNGGVMMSFWENKRVLVTGGAGFLGTQVVRRLRERETI